MYALCIQLVCINVCKSGHTCTDACICLCFQCFTSSICAGFQVPVLVRNHIQGKDITTLWVPEKLKFKLVKGYHAHRLSGHQSSTRVLQKMQQKYFWPHMARDIENFIKSCKTCQKSKLTFEDRKSVELQLPEIPDIPNERVHMDLFGPLRNSNSGNKYVLTMTDSFTKYVELVAIPDKSADMVAQAFFSKWICRFSAPTTIVMDQGREFCNQILVTKYSFCSIFRDLQDVHTCAMLQSQK